MTNPHKPPAAQAAPESGDQGVAETATAWLDDADAEALAALEEYRRTGESYSIEEAMAELDRLVGERRAGKV